MHIGIIGGGTMGLVLAYRLGQAGCRTTVLEAAPQIGGLSTWFDYGEFTWDKFYHVIPPNDEHLLSLFGELGIEQRMIWRETKTGFLWNNRLISMSNHWEFLRFPALNLAQKARLARGLIVCRKWDDPSSIEDKTAEEWLIQVFGRDVFQTIWEPLLDSKYGALKGETPAMIMWATIRRYDSTRSRGNGKESLGVLSGGLKTFYDALSNALSTQGCSIRTSSPVLNIQTAPDGVVTVQTPGEQMHFDRVISTVPTALLKKMAPALAGLSDQAIQPRFLGVICMAIVCREPLSPYYVTNLIQKGFSFTGIIGVSTMAGSEQLGGNHLIMLPRYDVPESPWFDRDAQSIADEFLGGLRGVWPNLDANIVRWFVNRERRVQALWVKPPPPGTKYRCNPERNVWSINAELAGRDTLNNNAIVRTANEAAKEFLHSMKAG